MSTPCPHCSSNSCSSDVRIMPIKFGHFVRKSDGLQIQRFRCKLCGRCFSDATSDTFFAQKKRHHNEMVRQLLCSGVSQRRCAMIVRINRKTVVRKLLCLGNLAESRVHESNQHHPPTLKMDFDDLETCIHTKCKPVAVTIALVPGQRRILGLEVSSMPAKGKIARIARTNYGRRPDERPAARAKLFERIKSFIHPYATIRSDQHPHYGRDVRKHFPCAKHETHKGRKGCVAGQGELKKIGYDPLFSINHTFAMFRANINRLFRRTWCTSKKMENLRAHLFLYADFHNHVLLKRKKSPG